MKALLLALGCTCLVPACAGAAWPHDPVNGNVGVCTAAGSQTFVTMASDGSGGGIVTWHDNRGGTFDIYVQRVGPAGAPLWTGDGILLSTSTASSGQFNPAIVPDGAGGAIIAWRDFRSGITSDIYAQRVNSSGATQWTAGGVALCTADSNQISPAIVSDGAGGAIVTWHDGRSGAFDVYAQRVNASGSPLWTPNGVALCTQPNAQQFPTIAPDGAGGAIVNWDDFRGGFTRDIYVQRVNASGSLQWAVDGVALCAAAGDQNFSKIAPDGSGGAIVTWRDARGGAVYDVYAQRVSAAGWGLWTIDGVLLSSTGVNHFIPTIATDGAGGAIVGWHRPDASGFDDIFIQRVSAGGILQWTANGVVICTAAGHQRNARVEPDGTGGAIVTWYDGRNGNDDIFAQRVSVTGLPLWTPGGAALCAATGSQQFPVIASDGAGGAIAAWQDSRGGSVDIYAQRVERFGRLGNPEPVILSVNDVPGDQGRQVTVSYQASYLEASPFFEIGSYFIWRSVPPHVAAQAILRGASVRSAGVRPKPGTFMLRELGAQTYAWEFVGQQPAAGISEYSFPAPTAGDSVAGGNPLTAFLVEADPWLANAFWDSAPDSGYSVDNLAPAMPASLTGQHTAGGIELQWDDNPEPDLSHYDLHRGTFADFVPGPSNRIASPTGSAFTDPFTQPSYYKLAAVDIHGNRSAYAPLAPQSVVGVGEPGPVSALTLGPPQPNPASSGAELRFALPREGPVTLALFDQQGRRVRVLVSGTLPAGEHAARWDGRDDAGRRVSSGIYFCRLEAGGRTIGRRLAAIH